MYIHRTWKSFFCRDIEIFWTKNEAGKGSTQNYEVLENTAIEIFEEATFDFGICRIQRFARF